MEKTRSEERFGSDLQESEFYKGLRELRRQLSAHKGAEATRKHRQPLSLAEFEKRRRAMKAALGF